MTVNILNFPLSLAVLAYNMKNTGLFASTLYLFLPRMQDKG